jgi:hypothetical protein
VPACHCAKLTRGVRVGREERESERAARDGTGAEAGPGPLPTSEGGAPTTHCNDISHVTRGISDEDDDDDAVRGGGGGIGAGGLQPPLPLRLPVLIDAKKD